MQPDGHTADVLRIADSSGTLGLFDQVGGGGLHNRQSLTKMVGDLRAQRLTDEGTALHASSGGMELLPAGQTGYETLTIFSYQEH